MKCLNSDATIISPSDNVYINNNNHTDDDDEQQQQQQQNEPLFNNNSIKMGPFSIRYSPTANKKKKKRYHNDNDLVQHEDKREGREVLHDFGMTPTISAVFDIEEYDDGCDDGSELYESSTRRRIPLRIILLGESIYVCGCSIMLLQ